MTGDVPDPPWWVVVPVVGVALLMLATGHALYGTVPILIATAVLFGLVGDWHPAAVVVAYAFFAAGIGSNLIGIIDDLAAGAA